jgi:cytochrome c551/c552
MRLRPNYMPLRLAFLALGMLGTIDALAQGASGTNRGRALFEQKQCSQCHFYEARGIAPSVKAMRASFKGDPARASAATSGAAAHASELKGVTPADIRTLAEFLAATTFAEQATAEAAKPKPGSPEAKRLAAQQAKQEAEAKAKAAAEAKAQTKKDAEAKAKAAAEAKIQAKKDAENQAKVAAEAKIQAKKDADAKAKQDADAKLQAKREADAQAKAKQEKEDLAKREADAKARKDTAALDAIKRENEDRAKREAEAQATAKRDAEAKAKRDADDRARQEAEAKAKREAEAQATAKRDAEAKAKRDAEAQAQQKRDAEAQAQARKPEPAAKAEPPKADAAAAAPGGKKKLAYRDGSDLPACPPPTGAPLGTVDENAAKAIIERVGCPQCHAYVQKKTGPPMKNIQEKYKGDWECVVSRLTKNKTHKEEGVTDDMKGNEYKIVADYIATRAK